MKLDVFSASAGTGKTYNICEELAQRIKDRLDPRRVLACTYTKAAAAELKQRVQKKLLESNMGPAAEALEGALLGTVHAVGLQLLTRFAVRAGLSPDLRVMPEDGEDAMLAAMIGQAEEGLWNQFAGHASRLGQSDKLPLSLIQEKRRNFISDEDFSAQLRAGLADTLALLGLGAVKPAGTLGDAYAEACVTAKAVLKHFDKVPSAKEEECFSKIEEFLRFESRSWYEIARLAKLKGNKKPGTHDALEPLREIGARIRRHPGLAAELAGFTESLIKVTLTLDARYRDYKAERGLVDYTDIEEHFLRLVQNKDVATDLARELHLVIVDEFQDTNPVQLAIFQRLAEIAGSSLWVGDPKQAIFSFAGTDPALMKAVIEKTKGVNKRTLSENNRSGATLVDLFNQLFVPVFGEEARVSAKRPAIAKVMDRWLLAASNNPDEQAALAQGVSDLIRSGTPPRDIALLVRRNAYGTDVAAKLKELGVPVQMEMGGLLKTRECALVTAALHFVRDHQDGTAAAQVLHLLGDRGWLERRLLEGRDKAPFDGTPILVSLAGLDAKRLSPALAAVAVIDRLELPTRVASWGEPGTRCANLDSFLALAREFEATASADGGACTLGDFLNHLEGAEADGEDMRRPQPGLDAVTILTYHSAKGLQWPVVILGELDKVFDPRLWEPTVTGGQPEKNLPLEGRTLRFWPWPFGRNEAFGNTLNDPLSIQDEVLATPAGQVIKKAEDDECVRLLYVGFTRARDRLILASRITRKGEHKHKWLDLLSTAAPLLGGKALGEHKLPGAAGILTVKNIDAPTVAPTKAPRIAESWLTPPGKTLAASIARVINPSDAPPVSAVMKTETLPGSSPFSVTLKGVDAADLGDACHAYFASLPSTHGLSKAIRLTVADRLIVRYGVESAITSEQLVAAGARLEAWVENRYPKAIWHTELALQGQQEKSILAGSADLVLETHEGLVVIDHKVIDGDPLESCKAYVGQIAAYGECCKSSARWFHLPLSGVVVSC